MPFRRRLCSVFRRSARFRRQAAQEGCQQGERHCRSVPAYPPETRLCDPKRALFFLALENFMDTIKPLFTATATATGGRNGHTQAADGSVSADLSVPKAMGRARLGMERQRVDRTARCWRLRAGGEVASQRFRPCRKRSWRRLPTKPTRISALIRTPRAATSMCNLRSKAPTRSEYSRVMPRTPAPFHRAGV
jgi:hypothetical protein